MLHHDGHQGKRLTASLRDNLRFTKDDPYHFLVASLVTSVSQGQCSRYSHARYRFDG